MAKPGRRNTITMTLIIIVNRSAFIISSFIFAICASNRIFIIGGIWKINTYKCLGCEHECRINTGSMFGSPVRCVVTGEDVKWVEDTKDENKR